jgi:DNA invertase Pin-like site-specific DNA recombinase
MDTVYNYGALAAAILNEALTVEKAISKFSPLVWEQGKSSKEEIEDMIQLRAQGVTYREIGQYFGVGADTVYHRIERYKAKAV